MRIYHEGLGRSAASRWSAPEPSQRTRREDHVLLIGRDEFRPANSLTGLLASIARLRFHRRVEHKMLARSEATIYHRTVTSV
jgi:hypothetical protein